MASRIRSSTLTVMEFVEELPAALVFEHNIQQRKANRWKSLTFSDFRTNSKTHHDAVQRRIEPPTAHQKDLASHNRSDHHFLARFREVFEFGDWCTTLYEQDCGDIRDLMRYCIILANMVWITPGRALVYIVHVLVAEGCMHQRGEYCVLLTSTCFQHVDNVNFLNLSYGPCKGRNVIL